MVAKLGPWKSEHCSLNEMVEGVAPWSAEPLWLSKPGADKVEEWGKK